MRKCIYILFFLLAAYGSLKAQERRLKIELFKDRGERLLDIEEGTDGMIAVLSSAEKAYLIRFIDSKLEQRWTKLIPMDDMGGKDVQMQVLLAGADVYLLSSRKEDAGRTEMHIAHLDTTGRIRKITKKSVSLVPGSSVNIVDNRLTWVAQEKGEIFLERTDPASLRSFRSSMNFMNYVNEESYIWNYLGTNGHHLYMYLHDSKAKYDTVPQIIILKSNGNNEPLTEYNLPSIRRYKNFSLPAERVEFENKVAITEGGDLVAYGLIGKPVQDTLPLDIKYTGFYVSRYSVSGIKQYEKEYFFSAIKDLPDFMRSKNLSYLNIAAVVQGQQLFISISPDKEATKKLIVVTDVKEGDLQKILGSREVLQYDWAPIAYIWDQATYDRRTDGPEVRRLEQLKNINKNNLTVYDLHNRGKGYMIMEYLPEAAILNIYSLQSEDRAGNN